MTIYKYILMKQNKYPVLEKDFQGKSLIYFDAACTYLRDQEFIENSIEYYSHYSTCAWDRESSYMGSFLTERLSLVRRDIRAFLWAKSWDYIIFTASTTDAINLLSQALAYHIDVFLVSDLEHNSNYLPWYESAKNHGKECILLPFQNVVDLSMLEETLVTIKKPFLLSFTHASNILWGIFDIASISKIVHKHGGYLFIDDAQYLPHHLEDVAMNDIDFLAFSWHKLSWPTGIGVLFIKEELGSMLSYSWRVGWWTLKSIRNGIPEYKPLPEYLEGWVQNFGAILWLGYIVHRRLNDTNNSVEHIAQLMKYFYSQFEKFWLEKYMKIISYREGSIITICPTTFHAIDFHQYCNYFFEWYIIAFRTGSFCADNYVERYLSGEKNIMRFSFGRYNTPKDIDILLQAFTKYLWWMNI